MTTIEKGRSEFEGCLSVREGQLNINMSSRNLDDAGIEKWCAWADECLPDFIKIKRLTRREADGFLLCKEANFSTNMIGDMGGRSLLRVLFTHKIAVRIIKLYKNNLGRAFASSMMDWLTHTPVPVIELHLSHNYIPREGAVDILKAVGHNKVYPAKNSNGSQQPLWLRLEQNIVEKANELLQVAEEQLMKIRGGKRGAILSMDNVPREIRGDAPCPLAQVAYLINQRERIRIPPEAQQWKPHAGPSQANRWRISLTPEQIELAAKAPAISLMRNKSSGSKDHLDAPEAMDPEVREGPVWNGLPVTEQLAAKKGQSAQQPAPGVGLAAPIQEADSDENSDEAPGPVHRRQPPNAGVVCKAPPVDRPVHGEAVVKAPPVAVAPMVKAPPVANPPLAFAGPGGVLLPPPSAPPPKPPPAKPAVDVTQPSQPVQREEGNESSFFPEDPLESQAEAFGLGFTPDISSSLPFAMPPLHAGVGPPPGLADAAGNPAHQGNMDPKDSFCDVPQGYDEIGDVAEPNAPLDVAHNGFPEFSQPPWRSPMPESDEELQDFGQMVQEPMHARANGHRHSNGVVAAPVDAILRVTNTNPFQRAKEVDFRTDLFNIKEAYMKLGRDEFMRRIQLPSWDGFS